MKYPFETVEPAWQQRWEEEGTYRVDPGTSKPPYYVLDMFPYPSGSGLHIGHPEGYTATDIVSRFKRMSGFNVLHPMGFDAFGLPTERQAMVENIHPRLITERNIATFTKQLKMLGFDYDWSRCINTTDVGYVRWTQWIFRLIYNSWFDPAVNKARPISELPIPPECTTELAIQQYQDEHRLAYIANIPVNWCEALGTVLANEEVDEWTEKGYTVERRPMRQWMLRITAYAQRLLDGLDAIDWPASTLDMQRHWIGRSEGARVSFSLENDDVSNGTHTPSVTVFTTRPDTIFGATYLVLAPEHELVSTITTADHQQQVAAYQQAAALKSDLERTELSKDKSGVFTGAYAINPANGKRIPVWIADYVLAHYGTGAIMAVPAHDERDFDFAVANNLPIAVVVKPVDSSDDAGSSTEPPSKAFSDAGVNCNSASAQLVLDGLQTIEAKRATIAWLEQTGIGEGRVQYKLRDWLFSRQRYWGEPMPILFFDDGLRRVLDEDELPLLLPEVESFQPAGTGESALATVPEWIHFVDPKTGKHARFETNTMPQWAGSCWYYLRYCDPHNDQQFCSPQAEKYWLGNNGIDLYVGGAEHAVLHLLYARFWHQMLFDYGLVSTPEPVKRLFHQGLILGEDGRKMSKSLGNTINPNDVVALYGADAVRLYEMFLGPLEASKPWNSRGIEGISRFLDRVWRLVSDCIAGSDDTAIEEQTMRELERTLHYTIKKTTEDIDNLSFNTAIAQFMIFVNTYTPLPVKPKSHIVAFLQCLAPFAPHITEELWHRMNMQGSIHLSAFPTYDPSLLVESTVEIVVQVNSKIRGKITVAAGSNGDQLAELAMKHDAIVPHLEGKSIKKTIVAPDKLVNFIVA